MTHDGREEGVHNEDLLVLAVDTPMYHPVVFDIYVV